MEKVDAFIASAGAGLLTGIAVALVLYFIPTIISWRRVNRRQVLFVNILAGRSIIGWVAALVLALDKKNYWNIAPQSKDENPSYSENGVTYYKAYFQNTSSYLEEEKFDFYQKLYMLQKFGLLSNEKFEQEAIKLFRIHLLSDEEKKDLTLQEWEKLQKECRNWTLSPEKFEDRKNELIQSFFSKKDGPNKE